MIPNHVRSHIASITKKCRCKIKSQHTLSQHNISGAKLVHLKESLQNNFKIQINDSEAVEWITINDVIKSVQDRII